MKPQRRCKINTGFFGGGRGRCPTKMSYTREEIVSRMLDLFFSRRDVFARSHTKPDGTFGYSPSCGCGYLCMLGTKCPRWSPQEVTGQAIYDHMSSTTNEPFPRTIGSYSTSPNQEARWIVFDVDAHNAIRSSGIMDARNSVPAFQTLSALSATMTELHIPHYVEESGMGWHVWVFSPPIYAEVAHKAGRQIVDMTEECATEVEVFPKQTQIAEGGFGNLVKVPYGLHWSGRKCHFIDLETKRYVQDQWEYLLNMQKVESLQLVRLAAVRNTPGPIKRVENIRQVKMALPKDAKLPGPPCVNNMLNARLREGEGRNQVLFQLAIAFRRGGMLDKGLASEYLSLWNEKQLDPLSSTEFEQTINHAYSDNRYSYGSDNPITGKYCEPEGCPICAKREEAMLNSLLYGSGMRLK